jgi:hypothetical protein
MSELPNLVNDDKEVDLASLSIPSIFALYEWAPQVDRMIGSASTGLNQLTYLVPRGNAGEAVLNYLPNEMGIVNATSAANASKVGAVTKFMTDVMKVTTSALVPLSIANLYYQDAMLDELPEITPADRDFNQFSSLFHVTNASIIAAASNFNNARLASAARGGLWGLAALEVGTFALGNTGYINRRANPSHILGGLSKALGDFGDGFVNGYELKSDKNLYKYFELNPSRFDEVQNVVDLNAGLPGGLKSAEMQDRINQKFRELQEEVRSQAFQDHIENNFKSSQLDYDQAGFVIGKTAGYDDIWAGRIDLRMIPEDASHKDYNKAANEIEDFERVVPGYSLIANLETLKSAEFIFDEAYLKNLENCDIKYYDIDAKYINNEHRTDVTITLHNITPGETRVENGASAQFTVTLDNPNGVISNAEFERIADLWIENLSSAGRLQDVHKQRLADLNEALASFEPEKLKESKELAQERLLQAKQQLENLENYRDSIPQSIKNLEAKKKSLQETLASNKNYFDENNPEGICTDIDKAQENIVNYTENLEFLNSPETTNQQILASYIATLESDNKLLIRLDKNSHRITKRAYRGN